MNEGCPTTERLDLFHRGELSPEHAAEIRAHLDHCKPCRDQAGDDNVTLALMDDIRVVVEREADSAAEMLLGPVDGCGVRFGPYVIRDVLGTGGMSKVYRAEHFETGAAVALKLLKGEHQASEEIRKRFEREAQAMARLEHPNIVRVFGCFSDRGRVGLAMEIVPGGSLGEWVAGLREKEEAPDPLRVLEVSLQAARGLGAAHAAGLVHRDIKPSNLLLDENGQAQVSDFGVVQALESTTWVTGTGHRIGTPAYMSPEQCRGERVTPASDVYSLGVTMFELATGRLPFEVDGDSPFAHMLRHISAPAPDPCRFNKRIAHGFALVILRCLEKAPEDRYPNGDALAAALEKASRPNSERHTPTTARKTGTHINLAHVRRQLENLPQRSIVAWACRVARRVQMLNTDARVARAIDLAESVGVSENIAGQPHSTRMLAHMQSLRAASLAAADADGDAGEASLAAARAAAATSSTAAARCAADAAADAVFAVQNALIACSKSKMSVSSMWREVQKDYRKLRQAALGAPGTIGLSVPPDFWDKDSE